MIKQPGILITRNTFHINDTRRFKSVHFQDIKSNFVSQAITETPRAMSKKYTRISKSHIVKRIVETKLHSAIFLENYSPTVSMGRHTCQKYNIHYISSRPRNI